VGKRERKSSRCQGKASSQRKRAFHPDVAQRKRTKPQRCGGDAKKAKATQQKGKEEPIGKPSEESKIRTKTQGPQKVPEKKREESATEEALPPEKVSRVRSKTGDDSLPFGKTIFKQQRTTGTPGGIENKKLKREAGGKALRGVELTNMGHGGVNEQKPLGVAGDRGMRELYCHASVTEAETKKKKKQEKSPSSNPTGEKKKKLKDRTGGYGYIIIGGMGARKPTTASKKLRGNQPRACTQIKRRGCQRKKKQILLEEKWTKK